MGFYLDPTDITKEEWLEKHGRLMPLGTPFSARGLNEIPIVLLHNPTFTAAAITCDEGEYNYVNTLTFYDRRPRQIYFVSLDALLIECPFMRELLCH
jgi:hypothetical protein